MIGWGQSGYGAVLSTVVAAVLLAAVPPGPTCGDGPVISSHS
jgi:hypothetical protein